MILGFLGKGGSGKSSIATQFALWLASQDKNVLAIDADHNMDLSFNINGGTLLDNFNYFGSSISEMSSFVGLDKGEKYDKIFLKENLKSFSLDPLDQLTEKFSRAVSKNMRIMAAGPQTDTVLYGKSCSHSLTTPLKIYLPLLNLNDEGYVVLDEKAGADGVSTGIITGIDVGVIVCEPALHSIKTAKQIAGLMDFYETPYVFIANKIQSDEGKNFLISELGKEAVCYFSESKILKRNPSMLISEFSDSLLGIYKEAKKINQNNRKERTKNKFNRNRDFGNS